MVYSDPMSSVAPLSRLPGPIGRAVRRIVALLLVLLALPYVLTPLYLFVRPVSTLMLWRWLTGAKVERIYVPIEEMARSLPLSVIVAEDARFCRHSGIDWTELSEAIEEAGDLSEARGASTIVQQVAKNLFLWPGRSFVRKALEFPLALWIDLVLPKRRVMEIYLNIAEWGPDGQFGAEAGARRAFGKSAQSLTSRESALLAAVLPDPHRRLAGRPGPGLRRLAGIYEARARRAGWLADCLELTRRH
ncbi:MAG: monofunctional biosynthetic peptidoglycan transglycosylase [Variibacter sp.]|nr:monofunctional biosynthetic peptidoglycan transglycosylase [Variibacter sp.]